MKLFHHFSFCMDEKVHFESYMITIWLCVTVIIELNEHGFGRSFTKETNDNSNRELLYEFVSYFDKLSYWSWILMFYILPFTFSFTLDKSWMCGNWIWCRLESSIRFVLKCQKKKTFQIFMHGISNRSALVWLYSKRLLYYYVSSWI